MSGTIRILKNKANLLYLRLRCNDVEIPQKHKLDLLAFTVGEKRWSNLVSQHSEKPRPYTSYQPSVLKLQTATGISHDLAKVILREIRWPSEYVPCFNTLPLAENGQVLIPTLFICSHIFSLQCKREPCILKRVPFFHDDLSIDKDRILYTGESLNHYDELIFFSLLHLHPADIPVGRYFRFGEEDLKMLWERSYAVRSLELSFDRMRDCRIWIPNLNFFGPLILNYRKEKSKRYLVALNPELTKFYYDPMYAKFMDDGNLFHHKPVYEEGVQNQNMRLLKSRMDQLKEEDFIQYSKKLGDLWPTHDSDMSAIFSIIFKNAVGGQVSFKMIEEVEFIDSDRFTVKMPDWYRQAYRHFTDLYGKEAGDLIFQKAMARFTELFFVKTT